MHVGGIMSTVEGVQYRGGKSLVIWVPHGTEHPPRYSWYPPRYSWYPPTFIMISPTVLKFQRMISPHSTEHPPRYSWYPPRASWYPPQYWTSPTVLKISPTVLKFQRMISPTVLNTPHGTHDIPHGHHDIPPRYWTPHGTQDIPPRYSWYPPTVLNTPHGTEHPPRYCTHIIQGAFKTEIVNYCLVILFLWSLRARYSLWSNVGRGKGRGFSDVEGVNPRRTGLWVSVTWRVLTREGLGFLRACTSGEGCYPPALVKFDPDDLGQWNAAGW